MEQPERYGPLFAVDKRHNEILGGRPASNARGARGVFGVLWSQSFSREGGME